VQGDVTASQVADDQELLDRLGYGILDIQSESGVGFEDVRRFTYVVDSARNPRAKAAQLQSLLGRPFTEREARAAWLEIVEYKARKLEDTDEEIPIEDAAREWNERHGFAFRRRWSLSSPEAEARQYIPGARERSPGAVGKVAGRALPELRPLLEAGFSVIDVLAEAVREPFRSTRLALRGVRREERSKHYVRLVSNLTGWTLSEEEAERVWAEALKHKVHLSDKLGHEVSMERAVVDYFKRLRLSGLDRAVLWETGSLFAPNTADYYELDEDETAPSTRPNHLFPG